MKEIVLKPTEMDQKHFHCWIKQTDTAKRRIRGFASTRNPDRENDVVEPDALRRAMSTYMQNPIVLRDHMLDKPIGTTVDYSVSFEGLEVEIEIAKDTALANETWALISQGVLKALSIGFIAQEFDRDREQGGATIRSLELIEISVVSIPANRESLFNVVKAFQKGTDLIEKKDTLYRNTLAAVHQAKGQIERAYKHLSSSDKLVIDELVNQMNNLISLNGSKKKEAELRKALLASIELDKLIKN